jgi:hypothetical protein
MIARLKMNEWGREIPDQTAKSERNWRRRAYLPGAIERAEQKLARLKEEASHIGLTLKQLEDSHHNGDQIATEYLKRLGYWR